MPALPLKKPSPKKTRIAQLKATAPLSSATTPEEARAFGIVRWKTGTPSRTQDDILAAEEPLEIRVRGKSVAITMRTPGQDRALAAGFLVSEGLVKKRREIVEIAPCQAGEAAAYGNVINIFLAPDVTLDFDRLTRHVFASSSCGLCGKASIESVHQHFPPVKSSFIISAEQLTRLPAVLQKSQATFKLTGGLHAAAIFDAEGNLQSLHEDVGRHNAVDKVIGESFLTGTFPLVRHVLLVSGRASFEIMQKALAAGIPIVAAISAPSSLAVEFARESGQTLVGFLRGETMNIYAGVERIKF